MAPKVTLYAAGRAPNPLKVAILLEELNVEYAVIHKTFGDGPGGVKAPDFIKINANGRVPALVDHTNNDHTVWESGAILLYVAERFDTAGKFTGITLEERSKVWEWLFFQVSGLGPSQGQAGWFINLHPVKDLHPSVIERYQNETYRIYGVLEERLQKEEWLVLGKFTVADIAHYPWLNVAEFARLDLSKYPKLSAYHKRIQALPNVKKAYLKVDPPK